MALNQSQRIQISGEQLDLPSKITSANNNKSQIETIKADLLTQDDSIKVFFDKYNGIANHYQTEQRWLDGTTYAVVTEQQIQDSAQRISGNIFFPGSPAWTKFQPKVTNNANGNPTTTSTNNENDLLNNSLALLGISAILDFLVNGQSSGVSDDTLSAPYSPGAGTMLVTGGGQTPGNVILLEGGGFSGLFKVLTSIGTTLTVSEIVSPDGTLPMTTTSVKENISGFTNTERNHLTSSNYQHVLTELANDTIAQVLLWETSLNNQLIELNANLDTRSPQVTEIATAVVNVNSAKSAIDTWQVLPNTGTLGTDSKFTNNNITALESAISTRNAQIVARGTEISTALGTVTQAVDGSFSGTGIYTLRFDQINNRINLSGGPLTEFYEKDTAVNALDQMAQTLTNKLSTFNSELRTEALTQDGDGSHIAKVLDVSGFNILDSIFLMADSQDELSAIVSKIGTEQLELSIVIPTTYTKSSRARIYKQL